MGLDKTISNLWPHQSPSGVSLYYLWTRSIRNTNYCFQSITFRGADCLRNDPQGTLRVGLLQRF